MEIYDSYQNISSIYQQLASKKAELANLDKKELEKSTFEKMIQFSLERKIMMKMTIKEF